MSEMEAGGCKPLTTFVHADTSTFREVVQRLTGGGPNQTQTQQEKSIGAAGISSKRTTTSSSTSKLHERRQYMRPKLEIVKPTPSSSSSSSSHFKSSSPLDSPSTILSKLSIVEQENKGGGSPAVAPIATPGQVAQVTTRSAYLVPSDISQIKPSKSMIVSLFLNITVQCCRSSKCSSTILPITAFMDP